MIQVVFVWARRSFPQDRPVKEGMPLQRAAAACYKELLTIHVVACFPASVARPATQQSFHLLFILKLTDRQFSEAARLRLKSLVWLVGGGQSAGQTELDIITQRPSWLISQGTSHRPSVS